MGAKETNIVLKMMYMYYSRPTASSYEGFTLVVIFSIAHLALHLQFFTAARTRLNT